MCMTIKIQFKSTEISIHSFICLYAGVYLYKMLGAVVEWFINLKNAKILTKINKLQKLWTGAGKNQQEEYKNQSTGRKEKKKSTRLMFSDLLMEMLNNTEGIESR